MPSLDLHRPALPLALLAAVCLLSLGARAAWLGAPCRGACPTGRAHALVFDERYYVNAARVIAGLHPPSGAPYAESPRGVDPNAEHPQLVKLIVAGSIELLGDAPWAWRLGSLIAGTLAILGLYALVRAAGGGPWPAVGAAALMAADNLMLVHGRIATLDIYAVAAMAWGAALYLRGRPLVSGLVIGLGVCTKLVAAYVLVVLALYEAVMWWRIRRPPATAALRRLGVCVAVSAGSFLALLTVLDRVAPPYDDSLHARLTGGPFTHLAHMISYAAAQRSPHGPQGIASYPWGWFFDYKPIVYLNVNPSQPAPGLSHLHPAVHFLGLISPPILLLALPALVLAIRASLRGRVGPSTELAIVAAAWVVGTWGPFALLSLVVGRTSYLYYMVIVMPGLYIAVAWLLARLRPWPKLTALWALGVLVAAVIAYPLTPLP